MQVQALWIRYPKLEWFHAASTSLQVIHYHSCHVIHYLICWSISLSTGEADFNWKDLHHSATTLTPVTDFNDIYTPFSKTLKLISGYPHFSFLVMKGYIGVEDRKRLQRMEEDAKNACVDNSWARDITYTWRLWDTKEIQKLCKLWCLFFLTPFLQIAKIYYSLPYTCTQFSSSCFKPLYTIFLYMTHVLPKTSCLCSLSGM